MFSNSFPIPLHGKHLVCSTIHFEVRLQDNPKYTSEYASKYTPSILLRMPRMLQVHLSVWYQIPPQKRSEVNSQLHSMAYSQLDWLFASMYGFKLLWNPHSSTIPSTTPSHFQLHSQVYSHVCLRSQWMVHSQPSWPNAPKYTLNMEDSPNRTWQCTPICASVCLM